jgi:hypothetical protein
MSSPRRSPRYTAKQKGRSPVVAAAEASPSSRSSPRLVARHEAAKQAARAVAAAVRQRVWAEARAEDGAKYYYSLAQQGVTAWELPSWAILRAAGRDSICPPRPSIGRRLSKRVSSAAGSSTAAAAARAVAAAAAIRELKSEMDAAAAERPCDGNTQEATEVEEVEEAEADEAGKAEEGEEEDAAPSNPQLQELLGLMLGWLQETKNLYHATRTDLFHLHVDQTGEMKQAATALKTLQDRLEARQEVEASLREEARELRARLEAKEKAEEVAKEEGKAMGSEATEDPASSSSSSSASASGRPSVGTRKRIAIRALPEGLPPTTSSPHSDGEEGEGGSEVLAEEEEGAGSGLSEWAAECDRLRDALQSSESRLASLERENRLMKSVLNGPLEPSNIDPPCHALDLRSRSTLPLESLSPLATGRRRRS